MLDSSRNISESLKNNTNTLATMELKSLLKKKKLNSWSFFLRIKTFISNNQGC